MYGGVGKLHDVSWVNLVASLVVWMFATTFGFDNPGKHSLLRHITGSGYIVKYISDACVPPTPLPQRPSL